MWNRTIELCSQTHGLCASFSSVPRKVLLIHLCLNSGCFVCLVQILLERDDRDRSWQLQPLSVKFRKKQTTRAIFNCFLNAYFLNVEAGCGSITDFIMPNNWTVSDVLLIRPHFTEMIHALLVGSSTLPLATLIFHLWGQYSANVWYVKTWIDFSLTKYLISVFI